MGHQTTPVDSAPFRDELVSFVRRLGVRTDAEDIVQEAMLRALQSPPSRQPRAWLYRIAINIIRDGARRRGVERTALSHVIQREPRSAPASDVIAADRENTRAARAALASTPERQRLALLLRIDRGMEYDEIGLVLDCTAATARQHFHLGLKAVRNKLGDLER